MTLADKPHGSQIGSRKLTRASSLIRLALVLSVLGGVLLGYWASVINEQTELPGITGVIRVESWAQKEITPQAVLAGLTECARREGETVVVEIPSPRGRTAYGAGGRFDTWLTHGYRGLWGSTPVSIRQLSDVPHEDYRQMIGLTGNSSFSREVTSYLDDLGIRYEEMHNQGWVFLFRGTTLGYLSALLAVFCLALCAIGAILGAHADAVRRLHGYGLWRSVSYELVRAGRGLVTVLLVAVALGVCALAFLANVSSALQLLKYLIIFIGVALTLCVIALTVGIAGLRRASVVVLLSGKLPGGPILVSVLAVRIMACLALASLTVGAVNYSLEWSKQHREQDLWTSAQESYSLTLSGARGLEELTESRDQLASRLRALSSQGRLLYHQYLDQGIIPTAHLDREAMVYNRKAAESSLAGAVKDAYQEAENRFTGVVAMVPDNLASSADLGALLEASVGHRMIPTVTYKAGDSRARTWEAGIDEWINRAEVHDPIVIVIPDRDLPQQNRTLIGAVTQNDVTLTNYSDFHNLQSDAHVGSFIRSASLMSSVWAQHHQTMGRTAWVYVGGVLGALLLNLVAAMAVWYASFTVFHQRLRASYVNGVVPWRLVLLCAGTEIGVLAVTAFYLWNRGAAARQWSTGGALEGSVDPAMIAMFHVPTIAWWIALMVAAVTSLPVTSWVLRRRSVSQLIHVKR